MRTDTSRLLVLATASIALVASVAAPARGQNALGTGRALDSSLQRGVRTNSQVSNILATLRLNNAIVTGNAPGGRSFQGFVGYRAANDFRSSIARQAEFGTTGVGSNDLFAFQRDSLYSGLAAQGVRGVNALQYQMRLATGASTGELPALPIVRRPATPVNSSLLTHSRFDEIQSSTLDSYSIKPGTMRSTSEFLSNSFLAPTLLRTNTPDQSASDQSAAASSFTIATPLRGVVTQSTPTFTTDLLNAALNTPGTPAQSAAEAHSSNRLSSFVEPRRASYDRILDDLRTLTKSDQGADDLLNSANQPLEPDQTSSNPLGSPGSSAGDAAPGSSNPSMKLEDRLEQLRQSMTPAPPSNQSADQTARRNARIKQTIDMLKSASPTVKTLAPETNAQRDFFAEQMHLGQQAMQRRRWFDAEEHFASAVAQQPDDALAAIGRIHAEIGAGLFLSAAVNLERLLRQRPGLISVRFDRDLLPNQQRLSQNIQRLRKNMQANTPMGRHSAFLLAYIGRQIGDDQSVADGFDAIKRITGKLGEKPDPFFDILSRTWRN